jgi:hypothetical protein
LTIKTQGIKMLISTYCRISSSKIITKIYTLSTNLNSKLNRISNRKGCKNWARWHMPAILTLGLLRQKGQVWGQPGLHNEAVSKRSSPQKKKVLNWFLKHLGQLWKVFKKERKNLWNLDKTVKTKVQSWLTCLYLLTLTVTVNSNTLS